MESGSRLVAQPAVDGKQYVYRVYAPKDAVDWTRLHAS